MIEIVCDERERECVEENEFLCMSEKEKEIVKLQSSFVHHIDRGRVCV